MTKRKTGKQSKKSKNGFKCTPECLPKPSSEKLLNSDGEAFPTAKTDITNKEFLEVIGAVRNYADLFTSKKTPTAKQNTPTKHINHELYGPGEVKPKTGDFIRFKNLSSSEMARFNGKIGLIKKRLDESRFQVMTMNDANDFSVLESNFDVIKNCNSEYNRMEIGEMVWPKIKGSTSPNNHWVKDRVLTGFTMQLFDALNFYKFDEVYENFGYAESMPKESFFQFYIDRFTTDCMI